MMKQDAFNCQALKMVGQDQFQSVRARGNFKKKSFLAGDVVDMTA